MVKMVSLKRTKADEHTSNAALGMIREEGGDGFEVHLDDHHLRKLGLDGELPHGHPITLTAEGELVSSHMHDEGGEPRRRMTFRFGKAGVEHEPPKEESHRGGGVRKDVESAYAKAAKD